MTQLKITNHDNGQRLDTVLARTYPQYSRAFFQKFLKKGGATLLGSPREPDYRVRTGDIFKIDNFETFSVEPVVRTAKGFRSDVEPRILFEDQALLAIDKPAGLVVHPAPGHRAGTLIDWLKTHLGPQVMKVFTDPERLGLVHRLDKDTSGVLLIAKSIVAQTAISRQFHDRTVKKTYVAFVEGVPTAKTGVIQAPVGRSRKVPTRMAVAPHGRESETAFEVTESLKEVAQVSLHPKTGRTHQIRVHLSAIGHPIVGDVTYGAKSIWAQTYDIHRPLLHAEELQVMHPTTKKKITFEAPWPEDFLRAQRRFRQAFSAVVLGALLSLASGTYAAEGAPRKETSSAPAKKTASATSALSSEVRKLKQNMAELEENVANLNAAIEKVDVSSRVKGLEQAIFELNAKITTNTSATEESKTQVLDINRKLKSLQDTIEQMRDQFDRLQQQMARQPSSGSAPSYTPPTGGSRAP